MKIKITYSYDGTFFCGSQKQPNKKSVEDALETAFCSVGIFEKVISSSRTDKGVHGLNQVSTTNCPDFWDLQKLKIFLNRKIHPHIHIKTIGVVNESFHPRYSAKFRSYRYILNHNKYNTFMSNYCYFYKEINIKKLNILLKKFEGVNDFKNFMKTGSDTVISIRELQKAYAYKYNNLTIIKFKANGFLRAQVRLMVANVLKELETKNEFSITKAITRTPAPACALYLERVFY